jgi:hypothetical protein
MDPRLFDEPADEGAQDSEAAPGLTSWLSQALQPRLSQRLSDNPPPEPAVAREQESNGDAAGADELAKTKAELAQARRDLASKVM